MSSDDSDGEEEINRQAGMDTDVVNSELYVPN